MFTATDLDRMDGLLSSWFLTTDHSPSFIILLSFPLSPLSLSDVLAVLFTFNFLRIFPNRYLCKLFWPMLSSLCTWQGSWSQYSKDCCNFLRWLAGCGLSLSLHWQGSCHLATIGREAVTSLIFLKAEEFWYVAQVYRQDNCNSPYPPPLNSAAAVTLFFSTSRTVKNSLVYLSRGLGSTDWHGSCTFSFLFVSRSTLFNSKGRADGTTFSPEDKAAGCFLI